MKYVTVLAKTRIVRTNIEFNFIATVYRDTQYLSIISVSSDECWLVYFSEQHFANPPKSRLEHGTHGRRQLGSGDLYLLPRTIWPTGMSLVTMWVSWLLIRCPKWRFYWLPSHQLTPPHPSPPCPTPFHPTAHPTHPLYYQYWRQKGTAKIPWNLQ